MSATKTTPLKGIKVIELGTLIAAPFCSRILAEFGAEVIKIEPPAAEGGSGGDPLRQAQGHRLPVPAQHDQQLLDVACQHHRGAGRQDGVGHAADLHALCLAHDGTQEKGLRPHFIQHNRRFFMALVSLRQVLDHAAEHGYGVPAFNVNNLEQVQAIMEAAQETHSPVILQASAGARKYAGEAYLRHLVLAAIESHPDIPVVMHQDHGVSPAVCQQSIRSGFSSVMMDGSLYSQFMTRQAGLTPEIVNIMKSEWGYMPHFFC